MTRIPRAVRALLTATAWLVPSWRRLAWRRQWDAEIQHRIAHAPDRSVFAFAIGSVRHALQLRLEDVPFRGVLSETRHSGRALLRRPGFALLAVGTLAMGIGSATAVFSLAEAMLLRPLPLPEADRLVRLFSTNPSRGMSSFSVSYPDYEDLAEQSGLFAESSLYQEYDEDISGVAEPERIRTVAVHENFFQTLGSSFVMGRPFSADDHAEQSVATAVLSEAFWIDRFGADSTIVGETVRLDGDPHTVIGVVARGQSYPARGVVWTPLQWGGTPPEWADVRSNHSWQVVARLHPEATAGEVSQVVRDRARAIYSAEGIDERDVGTEAMVLSLRAAEGGEDAGALFATLGTAVFLVLLIACMNASGLLITRAWSKAGELSVRAALGAGRARLAAAVLGESVMLALAGGAIGLWLGHRLLVRGLAAIPPRILPEPDVRMNVTVLVVGLAISVFAALAAGLAPALHAARSSLASAMKGGGRGGTGRSSTRLRRGLIVAEIALSLALLVSAGNAVRGFQRQIESEPGFDAEGLVVFGVRLPSSRYEGAEAVDDYIRRALDALERHPEVTAATATSQPPLGAPGTSPYRSFIFDGEPEPPQGPDYGALWIEVDPGFFATLRVGVAKGRAFTDEDDAGSQPVAIVNERMETLMAGGGDMLGREIRSVYDENVNRTVVGVVRDIQINGVARPQRQRVVFVPRTQAARHEMVFMVRTTGEPEQLLAPIRATMASLDGDVALSDLQSLRDAHAQDLAGIRFLTSLFATFGFLALGLAVSGVYGLISYSVALRRQEVGVRMAMGATTAGVRWAILRETMTLACLGLLLGLPLAYAGARVLAAGLSGVALLRVDTFIGVCLLLTGAVVAASWGPAGRATRVDPVEALAGDQGWSA